MFKTASPLLLSLAIGACATDAAQPELSLRTEPVQALKADAPTLSLGPVDSGFIGMQTKAATLVFTSADQYVNYFEVEAPQDVDFANEWIIFHAAGMRSSGGYSVSIDSVELYANGIIVRTNEQAPGPDCIVTKALTAPTAMVKIDIPQNVWWYYPIHTENVYSCEMPDLPNAEERALVDDSFGKWLDLTAEKGENYAYTRTFASVFNFFFRTDFVVKNGKVVKRTLTTGFGVDESVSWVEVGSDVGSHDDAHEVALIDELYEQCLGKVLLQNPADNFINVSFDENGLLQSCSFFPKNCADDCSQGITSLRNIEFLSSALPVTMVDMDDELTTDDFFLNEVTLDGTDLSVTVGYAGGCAAHEFALNWNGAVLESFPPQVNLVLTHDGNGDNCEAFLTETLVFDISTVIGVSAAPVIVHVKGPASSETITVN